MAVLLDERHQIDIAAVGEIIQPESVGGVPQLGPGARSKRASGVREERLLLLQKVRRRGVLLLRREVRARR